MVIGINSNARVLTMDLSAREYDCLRLVAKGRRVAGIAVELSISISTVEKHLSSTRHKLGVSTTIEAVRLFWLEQQKTEDSHSISIDRCENTPEQKADTLNFLLSLENSKTLDESWGALKAYFSNCGYWDLAFGVIAEPFGSKSNGANLIEDTMSPEIFALYESAGGIAMDPVLNHVSENRFPTIFSHKNIAKNYVDLPAAVREINMVLMDTGAEDLLVLPGCDHGTGAPYCVSLHQKRDVAVNFRADQMATTMRFTSIIDAFWMSLKRKRQLSDTSGLTVRQSQALTFHARGMNGQEVAERLNISSRSCEKTVSNARKALGATTTSAAIFRASVYGALQH